MLMDGRQYIDDKCVFVDFSIAGIFSLLIANQSFFCLSSTVVVVQRYAFLNVWAPVHHLHVYLYLSLHCTFLCMYELVSSSIKCVLDPDGICCPWLLETMTISRLNTIYFLTLRHPHTCFVCIRDTHTTIIMVSWPTTIIPVCLHPFKCIYSGSY